MSKISPKLIDVERNRVKYIDNEDWGKYVNKQRSFHNDMMSYDYENCFGNISFYKFYKNIYDKINKNKEGRFPTQLFTNNKNELFKYVKNITN